MNVVYLGRVVGRNMADNFEGISVAGNKMQLNVLEQVARFSDIDLHIISLLPIAPYPKVKVLFSPKQTIYLKKNLYAICVSFINIPIVKQLWQMISLYRQASKFIKSNPDSILFTYNCYAQIGVPLGWMKSRYRCRVVTLLADLPVDSVPRKGLKRLIWKWYYNKTKQCITNTDGLIVLNEQAAKRYAPNAEYIVMDGGVNLQEYPTSVFLSPKEKNIVFSGGLIEYNGIYELLEAMKQIKSKEVKLHIYGSGPLESYVRQCCKEQDNILYFGSVDNAAVLQKQAEAFLLVNPRRTDDPVSQVTFPSKIFEYMMSGTPVLTTRLNGFSPEYYDKMFFVEKCDSGLLANKIDELAQMDQAALLEMAKRARNFVMQNKTWERQAGRIYDFIKNGR